MQMDINIDPNLQRKARAVCKKVSGLTLKRYYEYLIEIELKNYHHLMKLKMTDLE